MVHNETVDRIKAMEPDLTHERQQAHALLDILRSLAMAPVEEEGITAETAAAVDRARASLARGEGIPHEEILREFGLRDRHSCG
jgi:hypothetical protein